MGYGLGHLILVQSIFFPIPLQIIVLPVVHCLQNTVTSMVPIQCSTQRIHSYPSNSPASNSLPSLDPPTQQMNQLLLAHQASKRVGFR